MHLLDRPNGTFTEQEIARLTAYRAAVAAGFFSDWDDGIAPAEGDGAAAAETATNEDTGRFIEGAETSTPDAPS
jgi:hypothetical protein